MNELQAISPEISVIVPAYNAERWLRECLDSIAVQDFTDWEAIVVNDGSTDRTAEIASAFAAKDPRFRVITQENQGLGPARNTGIDASAGRWIMFLDADDMLFPHALSHLFKIALSVGADYVAGSLLRAKKLPEPAETHLGNALIFPSPTAISLTLYQNIDAASACGVLFNRNLFAGMQFKKGWFEDLDLTYRLMLRANKVAITAEKAYFYRQHPSSFIHNLSPGRLDAMEVTDRMVEYIRKNCPEALEAAKDRRFSAYCNAFALLCKASDCPEKLGLTPESLKEKMQQCFSVIREYRLRELFNPRVRLKNKLGALLSYCPPLFKITAKKL